MVRRSVAQNNAIGLQTLNATGRWPANDNQTFGRMESLLSRMAEIEERIHSAIITQTYSLNREQRFSDRKKAS